MGNDDASFPHRTVFARYQTLVPSDTKDGVVYRVNRWADGKWTCVVAEQPLSTKAEFCEGFTYTGVCRHIRKGMADIPSTLIGD